MSLQDYLYVDLPKLMSLHAQVSGSGTGAQAAAEQLANANPSHLAALEAELAAQGYLLDLTQGGVSRSLRNAQLRRTLATTLCVKVMGRVVIEDYQRLRRSMDTLPDDVAFVNKSVQASVRNTDDFRQTELTIAAEAEQLKEDSDRDSRAASQSRIAQMKSDLDDAINAATTVHGAEQWVLDGLKSWIDNHLAGIVNLRVYPSLQFADEQVFGNLKRECFVEQNLDSLHFAMGANPSSSITLVGIVTSVPAEEADAFDPLVEFDRETLSNPQTFEKGSREVLKSINTLEQLTRTCHFPRVMVQPLLVYRSFAPNPSATVG
jgi:hypothetical protein